MPTDAEWTTLENYLIANGYNYDGTTSENKLAKAIASTTGWMSSTETGAVGNDQSLNNISGFNAFPEGYRNALGTFYLKGNNAQFWSSSKQYPGTTFHRIISDQESEVNRASSNDKDGFSVRFVKDN